MNVMLPSKKRIFVETEAKAKRKTQVRAGAKPNVGKQMQEGEDDLQKRRFCRRLSGSSTPRVREGNNGRRSPENLRVMASQDR